MATFTPADINSVTITPTATAIAGATTVVPRPFFPLLLVSWKQWQHLGSIIREKLW